jgi:cytochrome c-type biogenesis protein CcmF
MATVLLGTLYPLMMDALKLGKISVGAPYFNQVFTLLASPLLFLMAIGPHCLWQQTDPQIIIQRLKYAMLLAVGLAVSGLMVTARPFKFYNDLGIILGLWIIFATLIDVWFKKLKLNHWRFPRHIWGMVIAHMGVAVATLGIAISQGYGIEADLRMTPGSQKQVGDYIFKMVQTRDIDGPNYRAVDAEFVITSNGSQVATLHPQKRVYDVGEMAMTDSDIHAGVFRDLYIALGEPLPGNAWSVRIYVKPFVRWIWAGGFLILLGGLFAMFDKRYRTMFAASPALTVASTNKEKLHYA